MSKKANLGVKRRQALIKRFSGFVDARGAGVKNTRNFGALADRVYFGARGCCKCGVHHFST